uniref:Uncharacterized protein n=1 Tax=uncultured marine thaumarchaeote AD1000_41_B03 TaxID=1455915 RepID=A0A075FRA9_9ARCH|nr:hypothetical protein [uncultured marine thaumarchaeote AD1000_41_B03]
MKKCTKNLVNYGFPMLALGSPVEFMESYEYKLLAEMIIMAKNRCQMLFHYIFLGLVTP